MPLEMLKGIACIQSTHAMMMIGSSSCRQGCKVSSESRWQLEVPSDQLHACHYLVTTRSLKCPFPRKSRCAEWGGTSVWTSRRVKKRTHFSTKCFFWSPEQTRIRVRNQPHVPDKRRKKGHILSIRNYSHAVFYAGSPHAKKTTPRLVSLARFKTASVKPSFCVRVGFVGTNSEAGVEPEHAGFGEGREGSGWAPSRFRKERDQGVSNARKGRRVERERGDWPRLEKGKGRDASHELSIDVPSDPSSVARRWRKVPRCRVNTWGCGSRGDLPYAWPTSWCESWCTVSGELEQRKVRDDGFACPITTALTTSSGVNHDHEWMSLAGRIHGLIRRYTIMMYALTYVLDATWSPK